MNWNDVCFTVDVEWACPDVLAHVLRLFDEHGVRATVFCTHEGISAPGHERALHPNFRRRGDTMRALPYSQADSEASADEAAVYEHVVRTTKAFCPEAVGVRTHSLFYDTQLLPVFARHGLVYDSSYHLPGARDIQPTLKECGILELPIYYMDYHDLLVQLTDFRADRLALDGPGLKVLDFHPNLVFINAASQRHAASTRPFHKDPQRLRAARFPGRGVETLLREILDHVATKGLPTADLCAVNRAWRASRAAA